MLKYQKEYYSNNKDKIKIYNKQYYERKKRKNMNNHINIDIQSNSIKPIDIQMKIILKNLINLK